MIPSIENSRSASAGLAALARSMLRPVVALLEVKRVEPVAAIHHPGEGDDRVVAQAAQQGVAAGTADQQIIAGAAIDIIVAGTAIEGIAAVATFSKSLPAPPSI